MKEKLLGSLQKSGQSIDILFAGENGDYFQGLLAVDSPDFAFDIIDQNGAVTQRLLDGQRGAGAFRFVYSKKATALRLTSSKTDLKYDLKLTHRIPLNQQIAPEKELLSPQMSEISELVKGGGGTELFWQTIKKEGTPLVEAGPDGNYILTFLQQGAKRNARLLGGPSSEHDWLKRLGNSDIWFKSYRVPSSTILSYRIAPDVPDIPGTPRERKMALLATINADPFNKNTIKIGPDADAQTVSTVQLPDAPSTEWVKDNPAVKKGSLTKHRFKSDILGNERDITLYQSSGFDPNNPDNVLLFVFDGSAYTYRVPTPSILDNLIAGEKIPSVMAVFVSNANQKSRGVELPGNPDFAKFMATELSPWVKKHTGIKTKAENTILAGSSYGGLASTLIAYEYPEIFGNVLSLSGSYWWSPKGTTPENANYVAHLFATSPKKPLKFYMSAGIYEATRASGHGILENVRHLRDTLVAKGNRVTHKEYAGGHDYLVWRISIAEGLISLVGNKSGN